MQVEFSYVLEKWRIAPCFMLSLECYIDMFKLIMFNYICIWRTSLKSIRKFPLPGTWIFNDPKLFFMNTFCLNTYLDYLQNKEPDNYEKILIVMENILEQEKMDDKIDYSNKKSYDAKQEYDLMKQSGVYDQELRFSRLPSKNKIPDSVYKKCDSISPQLTPMKNTPTTCKSTIFNMQESDIDDDNNSAMNMYRSVGMDDDLDNMIKQLRDLDMINYEIDIDLEFLKVGAYRNFQKTRAYHILRKKVEEYERITTKAYLIDN